MNGDKSAKSALRGQKQPRTHQQVSVQKKKKDPPPRDVQSGSFSRDAQWGQCDTGKEVKSAGLQGKRSGKVSLSVAVEGQRSPGAQRKLSDASNASEDLSKDSGCLSGKLSSSDSSSEISDCPSEGNKRDSPSCDNELSWIDGRVYMSPDSEDRGDGKPCAKAARDPCAPQSDAAGGGLGLFNSSGSFIDLMMAETTEDLVKEVEDLRSENEYLKDEVEELRCEMLEMRDMFQEEEVYQLQELRLQLEQANKTCRILQYRLRKAERRSIRVAQTGQVDGELVRSLEHDIKVAKSVSFRLCNELEVVQKKNSQLEWENVALLEKTQELEVAKQVLQAEVEKSRNSMKKRINRSTVSKAEKRLSQQIEDDSADLRCQLHFAKEELALMCKKLTKLVSESEAMREELAKYHSAYGDIDATQSPEGKQNSAHTREAEVKVHLKLVEEEATLLSRRIVELEVENRGLRAEMGDLREKLGRGGEEEEEDVMEENLSASTSAKDREGGEPSLKVGCTMYERGPDEEAEKGPVGGEWDPSDTPESDNNRKVDRGHKGLTVKDYETLLALRDHSCILGSAIQLLMAPPKNGHCSSPSCVFTSPSEADLNGKVQKLSLPGPLNEALELLQAMLLAFIRRVETLLTGEDLGKLSLHKDGHSLRWDSFSFLSGVHDADALSKQEHVEDLRTAEMSLERSHTAPEKSACRIYYSPPSARRVQLAQLKQSPVADRESVNTSSPWCTPPTSFSPLCLGSAANLSDDMKEMTASWRQRLQGQWVDVACSGTQTHMKPQMVSVGLQTDGTQGSVTARSSPSRVLSTSLARSHHISTSLDRVERTRSSTSSPKLYRRHSASGASSLPSSSSSSSSTSRDRALWNLNHQSHTGLSWTRPTGHRAGAGQAHSSLSSAKPPSKSAGANRYGMVTEFLRRVSGRAEKPAPASGQKTKSGPKNLERVPTRPPAAPLHRNDSVTRIVNQRFMRQREESRTQREESRTQREE
ncbi:uncharacterized protein, partial [Pempheris klunzingeri]|uniref:uncharacterized protein n=1 Tax=Pempheris klunzingeri TaxID=3127111 RepID=UPI0039813C45